MTIADIPMTILQMIISDTWYQILIIQNDNFNTKSQYDNNNTSYTDFTKWQHHNDNITNDDIRYNTNYNSKE